MDYSMLLLVLLGCPLAAALVIAVLPAKSTPVAPTRLFRTLPGGCRGSGPNSSRWPPLRAATSSLWEWFHLDGLQRPLFLGLIAVIAPAGVYSLPYVAHDVAEGKLGPSQVKQYYAFFSLFVFSMILAVTSTTS